MKRLSLTLAAIAPVLFAGCNGSDLSHPGSSNTGGLTSANSDHVGHSIAAAVAGGGSSGGGSVASGASSGAGFAADGSEGGGESTGDECYVVSGDESDADGDFIPVDALYTLTDCTWSEEGWTETYSGTESVSDPHPDAADYAYADSYDLNIAFTDGTNSENDHYVGSDDSDQVDSTYTFHEAFSVDFNGVYDNQDYAGNYSEDLTWAFTPTSCDFVTGLETVDGSWSETFDGETVSATLETTDPLQLDAACESGIVGGTIVATSGDSTETITWTGCDEYTLTYDGQ